MKKSKQLNSNQKKFKRFVVGDLDSLQKEFYKTYNPGYWLYRIGLLKKSHDHFERIKDILKTNIGEIEDNDFKKMLRTELHFLYFQMIETLFEIIFALSRPGFDNRNLWIALTFSNDKQTFLYSDSYKKIKEFAEGKLNEPDLSAKAITEIQGKKVEMPLLQWFFYFAYPFQLSDDQWGKNIDNIEKLLREFAKDFTDRREYNAYKHSLRFYVSESSFSLRKKGSQDPIILGRANDAIKYLEEHKENEEKSKLRGQREETLGLTTDISCKKKDKVDKLQEKKRIIRTTKSFDFERDYRCCLLIYELIKNIIITRKYSFLEELHDKEIQVHTFLDVQIPEVFLPDNKLTAFKISSTV